MRKNTIANLVSLSAIILLAGAGCSLYSQTNNNTYIQPPTSSTTTNPATTPILPTDTTKLPDTLQLLTYTNTTYNFSLNYLRGSGINESDGVRISMPITPKTTLTEKYLQIDITPNTTCTAPVASAAKNITINGISFTKYTGKGLAAGSVYDYTIYQTTRNNTCFALNFVLHSVNPDMLAEPVNTFDKTAETKAFDTMISSFKFTK